MCSICSALADPFGRSESGKGKSVHSCYFLLKSNKIMDSVSTSKLPHLYSVFWQRRQILVSRSKCHLWTVCASKFSLLFAGRGGRLASLVGIFVWAWTGPPWLRSPDQVQTWFLLYSVLYNHNNTTLKESKIDTLGRGRKDKRDWRLVG
jgi:hypothetical protein